MMINKILFSFLVSAGIFFTSVIGARAETEKTTVVCGSQNCDLKTHNCYLCKISNYGSYTTMYGTQNYSSSYTEYKCTLKSEKPQGNCEVRPYGGTKTEAQSNYGIVGKTIAKDPCKTEYFEQKYAYCYPCEIVKILFSAFLTAASAAYDVTKQAANVILIIAFILWIAGFAMKNVSSFTSVEPMKILQDLFVKFFKIILAFVIINSGLQTILHYSLVPLMNAGTDFADAILETVSDYTPPSYTYDDLPGAADGMGGSSSITGGKGYADGGSGGGGR